ncbi:MAG: hypothetical protein K5917_00415 [Clostridiales bacterium]|nr:hypothetical protein [Clostridiales bacterium]
MDTTLIFEQLEKIAEITEENTSLAQDLCSVAANKIKAMLKSNADESDSRVILAAAYFANKLLVKSSYLTSDAISHFKAGDVSISPAPNTAIAVADSMLCDALDCISDLLIDNNFVFRRI